jgi:hypothetical protein
MNKIEFIAFLCSYGVVVAFQILAQKYARLPEHVERAKPDKRKILSGKSKPYYMYCMLMVVLVSVSGIVGYVGMFFFWKPTPWIFTFYVIGKELLYPKALWHITSGWETFFNGLEGYLAGFIIALALLGPARHLFL